jgi:N-acetylglutamate synthase-like GNAT family acetyltransferase
MTEIRRAGPADAAAIAALTRDAYAKWVPVIGRQPKPMAADYDVAVREHLIELLEEDGELVALVECIVEPDHLLIENLAVSPAHQAQGHGRRLMARVEELARGLGLSEIRLYTNKLFAENVRLYVRIGYVIEREEPRNGGVTVHMIKRR